MVSQSTKAGFKTATERLTACTRCPRPHWIRPQGPSRLQPFSTSHLQSDSIPSPPRRPRPGLLSFGLKPLIGPPTTPRPPSHSQARSANSFSRKLKGTPIPRDVNLDESAHKNDGYRMSSSTSSLERIARSNQGGEIRRGPFGKTDGQVNLETLPRDKRTTSQSRKIQPAGVIQQDGSDHLAKESVKSSAMRDKNARSTILGLTPSNVSTTLPPTSDLSRHLGPVAQFNALPLYSKIDGMTHNRMIGYSNVQLDNLSTFFAIRSQQQYTPYFTLKAVSNHLLPPLKPPPFPEGFLRKRKEPIIVKIAYIASKARVSKSAVVRNRARRRVKVAMDLVINRGASLSGNEDGWFLPRCDMTYVVSVDPKAVDVSMETLCESVSRALKRLHQKPDKSDRPAPFGKTKGGKFASS